MSLIPLTEIRDVKDITNDEKQRIYDFLQGAVYCWCKNRKDQWFSVRDLMGGDNFDWNGTPLIVLFNKHKKKEKSDNDAINDAGKDIGWIMKRVIDEDQRNFNTKKEELVRKYRWQK